MPDLEIGKTQATRIKNMISTYTEQGLWSTNSLSDLVRKNGENYPDNWITDGRIKLYFSEFDRVVSRVAKLFTESGLEPGDLVAVQIPNLVEFCVVRAAISRFGGIFVNLAAGLRSHEVKLILEFVGAKAIVVPETFDDFSYWDMISKMRDLLPALELVFVLGDTSLVGAIPVLFSDGVSATDAAGVWESCDPRLPAELSFSSGTTGLPKAILRNESGWLVCAENCRDNGGLTAEDVALVIAPVGGSVGYMNAIFVQAVVGMNLVLVPKWNPGEVLDILRVTRPTYVVSVPTHLVLLMNEPSFREDDLSSVRVLFDGGGPMGIPTAKAVSDAGVFIMRGAGCTESGIVYQTRIGDPEYALLETVGRVTRGTQVRVVNEDGFEVESGLQGEIESLGATESFGYYKNESVNGELYTADGWLRHGDIVTVDHAGYFRYAGRKKDLIVRGGQNISPQEVEALVLQHPDIRDVAVVGMPDSVMGERTCAFIIPKSGSQVDLESISTFLRSKDIDIHKIPERVETVDSFPMSAGAKVQKTRLVEIITKKLKEEGKLS